MLSLQSIKMAQNFERRKKMVGKPTCPNSHNSYIENLLCARQYAWDILVLTVTYDCLHFTDDKTEVQRR